MQIGILGGGKVGSSLAKIWASQTDLEVVIGRRAPSAGSHHEATLADAVRASDVVVVAVPGAALTEVLAPLGRDLANKLVIDTTNRIELTPMNQLDTYRRLATDAVLYRAFNSLGVQVFSQPSFGGVHADHLYCGPDTDDRAVVERLITDVGLCPVHVGDLDAVQVLEASTQLYFALARLHGRHVALKVLHDAEACAAGPAGPTR